MKILVTGSSGFIGGKVVELLEKDKNVQIIKTTRKQEEIKNNILFYDLYSFDSKVNLYEYFGCPDIILHCAWDNVKNPNHLNHINDQVFYHIKFLENLIKNGIKKVSVLGTSYEYGKTNGEAIETQINNPLVNYAIAKDFLRRYIEVLSNSNEFIFQWIRIFNVYDKTGKTGNDNLICQLRKSLDKEEKYFNMTFGEKKLDFIEINKACLLIKKIIFQNQINGIINCCSGKPRTILNLVRQCLKEWKKNIVLNVGYYEYREFEPDNFHGSTTKLNEIIKVYNENF